MLNKTVVIHIGLPKCGSSSLQYDSENSQNILNIKKIYFLKSQKIYKNPKLYIDLISKKINNEINRFNKHDYAIYSDEVLLDPFQLETNKINLDTYLDLIFKKLKKKILANVIFVIIYRDFYDFIFSYYNQFYHSLFTMDTSLKSINNFLINVLNGKYHSFASIYYLIKNRNKNKNFKFVKLEDLSKSDILIGEDLMLQKFKSVLNKNNKNAAPRKSKFIHILRSTFSKISIHLPPIIFNPTRVKLTENIFLKFYNFEKVDNNLKKKIKEKFNF